MGKYSGILICSDFDDTLACNREISSENLKAIRHFCENGGLFTVISGRQLSFMKGYSDTLTINAPFAGLNGSCIWDLRSERLLHSKELDRDLLSPCVNYTLSHEKMSVAVLFSDSTVLRIVKEEDGILVDLRTGSDESIVCERVKSFYISEDGRESNSPLANDFLRSTIYKIVTGIKPQKGLEEYLVPDKERLLSLTNGRIAVSRAWPFSLEYQSVLATKGKALRFIKDYVGADVAIGIGNYENDLTMIEDADIGVAVKNSCPSLIEAADLTVKPCNEHALEDLILNLENILQSGGKVPYPFR